MKKQMNSFTCDSSTRVRTPEGFLKVQLIAGKAGVQTYTCDDMRRMGVDVEGNGTVEVARLPEDVFDEYSLSTLDNIDITNQHPSESSVTAENFTRVSKGHLISPGRKDGLNIRTEAIVKDKSTIDSIESGKKQVSLGYTNDYIKESGEFEGKPYSYVQRNIKYNHAAIVHRGRAKVAYVLDEDIEKTKKGENMSEELKEENEALKAKIKALEESSNDSALQNTIDTAVEERVAIEKKAVELNPEILMKGKTNDAIMRECLGDKITNDAVSEVVEYAFKNSFPVENTTHGDVSFGKKPPKSSETTNDASDAEAEYLKLLREGS